MKKGSFAYRFFVLLIAFVLISVAVLLPLAAAKDVEPFVFWIVGGVLGEGSVEAEMRRQALRLLCRDSPAACGKAREDASG